MRILISNDDGYFSPGIQVLHAAMKELGSATIVAPDRNRSGASNSLTLSHPLHPVKHAPDVYALEGNPTDCVLIGLNGLLDESIDMVVSGINDGPNLGDDTLYSGTVAAAMEGRHLGRPAIAVSMASHKPAHFATAARVTAELISQMNSVPLPPDTILNVNVPDVAYEALEGIRATRLGKRHPPEGAIREVNPRGENIYWIGGAGEIADDGPGTDFGAIHDGFVSVTPLQIDLTKRESVEPVAKWLEQLS